MPEERPRSYGREQPADEPQNRHYWRVAFTLAEYGHTDMIVTTAARDFTAAESAAWTEHETLHQDWPGPVEMTSIEYLGER